VKTPDLPQDEFCRLETLRSLDILDTSAEERFDRLTRMARWMFRVPIALVSLVDANRQWFNWNGQALGTLCIIDHQPRNLTPDELEAFKDLASMAERELAAVQMVAPNRRLMSGTRAVKRGDLAVEIHFKTTDELASLAQSFNRMVAGLREKERIKETFGQYLDPRIVHDLLANREQEEGGERRVMTVFFSDLADFTELCEGLSPDAVVRFLNRYFSLMSSVISLPAPTAHAGYRGQPDRRGR